MQLIDGKATAAAIKEQIAQEVAQIVANGGKQPHLAAILVGHDGGSETYVKNKVLACEKCGFKSTLIRYEEDVTEEELLACVDNLNHDDDVDGFIVQLPLPKHIDEQKVTMAIDYRKDVDGFHPVNVGRFALLYLCYATWHSHFAAALSDRNKWQEVCHPRQKQHRGQTNGSVDDAEAIW